MIRGATTGKQSILPIEAPPPMDIKGAPVSSRIVDLWSGPLQVRLAETAADIDAAQALRYRIFYETLGARPLPHMRQLQ